MKALRKNKSRASVAGDTPHKKSPSLTDYLVFATSIGSLIISIVSIIYTARTVHENEKWKKAEFLAAQYEKFSRDPSVVLVTRLHDWFERNVQLENKDAAINLDFVSFTLDNMEQHLGSDTIPIDPLRQYIGDAYDDYFNWLSLFHRYRNSKLFSPEDLPPYLERQINCIVPKKADDIHTRLFKKSLWNFIERRGYKEVLLLCRCYGHDPLNNKDEQDLLPEALTKN